METEVFLYILFVFLGGIAGYFFRLAMSLSKKKSLEIQTQKMTIEAQSEAHKIVKAAEDKAEIIIKEAKEEEKQKKASLEKSENRLLKKEELLDKKQVDLDYKSGDLEAKIKEAEAVKIKTLALQEQKESELQKVAKLTADQAKEQLLDDITHRYQEDLLIRIKKQETINQEKLEERAKDILITSIQRLASSTASDLTTTSVSIPSDDIKGKVIGKEGRNIRAFERAAGVELIVDDTPGSLVISSFDPIRRQVARVALENLILDGRIQPAKIEEFVERARNEINKIIKQKGEQAVHEVGILDFDPRIVAILGRLYFRTSYGQNVLQHSIEMAHVAGLLAEEIGANVHVAKASALVHDIGKALDHEMQGGHVKIGMRILEKFGADARIVTAMKSHHDDCPHETTEAVIVQVADMISGGRPGARRDTVENYLKRLEELETVANSFPGVEKVYALQAGREVRVFVHPEKIDDITAKKTAQDIAKRIEEELRYPGEIKVTVIRENRITEYAR